jgi:type II secretion system protein G
LRNWLLVLACTGLLVACSGREDQAKTAVTQQLSFRLDVGFRDLRSYPGDVVCGEYEEKNTMGGSKGFRPFISRPAVTSISPRPQELEIYCSEDPAASLFARYGIGPVDGSNTTLQQVYSDLRLLSGAMTQYLADNHRPPTQRQGLSTLVEPTTIPPLPRGYREGGYLEALPVDPWGEPYRYVNDQLGAGPAANFQLYTLGADKASGGKGENADISIQHLDYIDHVRQL